MRDKCRRSHVDDDGGWHLLHPSSSLIVFVCVHLLLLPINLDVRTIIFSSGFFFVLEKYIDIAAVYLICLSSIECEEGNIGWQQFSSH